jgi:hypothetical protein
MLPLSCCQPCSILNSVIAPPPLRIPHRYQDDWRRHEPSCFLQAHESYLGIFYSVAVSFACYTFGRPPQAVKTLCDSPRTHQYGRETKCCGPRECREGRAARAVFTDCREYQTWRYRTQSHRGRARGAYGRRCEFFPRVIDCFDILQNKRIRRKTDRVILIILIWVYFLQIADKTTLGSAAIFGLQEDTNLTGDQYSQIGSIAPIAQLAWQPFSSILIVKVPHRILMPALVFGWGVAQTCMAAAHNYGSLMATRFLLGLFEAGCLPLFSVITSQWYRRAEQPMRVAAWYGTNGIATIVVSALSYGLGHIRSDTLHEWQMYVKSFLSTVTSVERGN